MQYNFGFLMDQIAGHITNYRNLRSASEQDKEINATWHEINYYISGGMIEVFRHKLVPFVPTYFTGIARATIETRRALNNEKYDAIMSNLSVGVFFSPTFSRVPTLLDFDSTPEQRDNMEGYTNGKPDIELVAKLKRSLSKKMYNSATLLHAWSNWARDSVINEYGISPERVVVNPPGVNLEFWKPSEHQFSTKAAGPKRVLFVGGDFRRKGGTLLLEWYKSQNPTDCELHIVTREQVESRPGIYIYPDMQPNTIELLNLYQNSDLFVLPSIGECFGIATVEAMGAGLPVIASDVGGTADIIESGHNGFIVPAKDVKALSQAISTVLDGSNRSQQMGLQSRLLAEERFDLQKNAQRTFDYLKQISHLNKDCK